MFPTVGPLVTVDDPPDPKRIPMSEPGLPTAYRFPKANVAWAGDEIPAGGDRCELLPGGRGRITGGLTWDRALPAGLISQVRRVVQTADGGYAVLALRTNE